MRTLVIVGAIIALAVIVMGILWIRYVRFCDMEESLRRDGEPWGV